MRSAFSGRQRTIKATAQSLSDETYDLRGLNLNIPDQIMPKGESPYTINTRMYSRQDGEARVAIRTRKGSIRFTTPLGEALNVQNVATSTGDQDVSPTHILAQPFVPSSTGALTKMELHIKKPGGVSGFLRVDIYSDNAGIPGQLLAESSIDPSIMTDSYTYCPAYFMDAPTLTSGETYFLVVYTQDNGLGSYFINKTADAGALDLYSDNEGASWSNLGASFRFKSYLSTPGTVKGFTRRYPSNGADRTVFAKGTAVYSATDVMGNTPSSIATGLSSSAEHYRFENIDDKTIWVNSFDNAKQWDGTTVSDVTGFTGTPSHVIAWKNRLFFVVDGVLVKFSELYQFDNYPGVNFFYVPNPKTPDKITGWVVFQDNLIIFTHETKYIISGDGSISGLTQRQAVGTKGAVCQEAIAVDRNYVYFIADDGMLYRFNGVQDELLSDKMEPEFQSFQDPKDVNLHIFRNQVRIYYSKSPNPFVERMALYDIVYKQWFLDTGKSIMGSLEWTLDDNELVEFSSKVGAIFKGDQGYSDAGKPLDFKYWTAYKAYGSGAAKDRIRKFRPIVRTSDADYTLLVGKDIDFNNTPDMREYIVNGGGAKWGQFVWGDGTKWGRKKLIDQPSAMSGRGKHTQYRFERKGVETPVELYGYISLYKSGRAR